jgi:hypothetical protein
VLRDFGRAYDGFGSKCEELALGISCPVLPPLATEERTFGIRQLRANCCPEQVQQIAVVIRSPHRRWRALRPARRARALWPS